MKPSLHTLRSSRSKSLAPIQSLSDRSKNRDRSNLLKRMIGTGLLSMVLLLDGRPAFAQVANLAVTKTTSTPAVYSGGAATYTIRVSNPSTATATSVSISDTLPTGFTYDATIGIPSLQGSASRTTTANPTAGTGTPSWATFTLPAGASVEITFTTNIPTTQRVGTYQNPVSVSYTDSVGSKASNYVASSSRNEDVVVSPPPANIPAPLPAPVRSAAGICAIPGKDGPASLTGIVNAYYPGSASVIAGATSLTLGTATGATSSIAPGDLLLVIQMQDAAINSNNSNLYGSGTATNDGRGQTSMGSAGLYEYVVATSTVSGGTLTFRGANGGGLVNAYNNANASSTRGQRRFQVVRVPQFSNLTLTNTLQALGWNGGTGGIVAIDVAGQLNMNSRTIAGVNGGFRGGYSKKSVSGNSIMNYVGTTSVATGAGKGEGTAGTPQFVWNGTTALDNGAQGYPSGDYGRGAPANAGGGGNLHNAGGGGGGNGGLGGNGGIPWEGTATGSMDSGGRGGALSSLFSADPTRLFLAGGGGGGDANNATTGVRGGAGGGLVILRAGTFAGSGTINVTGDVGDVGVFNTAPDGAGGGGAGGTVLVHARQSSGASLSILANGGAGGNTLNDANDSHGPGAGGGGGVILSKIPGMTLTSSVLGGANGRTAGNIAHGAMPGQPGQAAPIVNDPFETVNDDGCLPQLTVLKTTSTPTIVQGADATYKITVSNGSGRMDATDVEFQDVLPTGFTYGSTTSIVPDTGVIRTSTNNPTVGDITLKWGKFTIPAGKKIEITFKATSSSTISTGTYQNPAVASYLDPKRATATATTSAVYDQNSSVGENVTVTSSTRPELLLVKRITAINGSNINPNDSTVLNLFVDDTTSLKQADDNNSNWPTGSLIGAIDGGTIKTGNTIEYTIYMLSSGAAPANNVLVCDRVPSNSIFKPDGYGSGLGITLNLGGISNLMTNVPDSDTAQYFSPGSDPTSVYPKVNCDGANTNGAIVVNVGNLTNATTNTTPNSFGFFRFRAIMK